ncbi:MAG: hypothetical protein HY811_05660 [Planctomycetes bacterium]|nr:hypothetical protein [Planctomycetota bacterium]
MKKKLFFLVLLLCIALIPLTIAGEQKLKLKWEKTSDDALKAAQQTNNPVLLFFVCGA